MQNSNTVQKITASRAAKALGIPQTSILPQLLGYLNAPIYNNDTYREYYREMATTDETVNTALEYIAGRVVSRIGPYAHEDERIKELVDASTESIRGTLTAMRRNILRNMLIYGYSVAEFTIKAENGRWLLSSMPVLDPMSIQFKMAKYPDNSYGIGSIVQRSPSGADIEIPVNKCLILHYGDETTPYGQSILRECYRWWRVKDAVPKFWAVALERFGQPLLFGQTSSEEKMDELRDELLNFNSRAVIVADPQSTVSAVTTPSVGVSSNYAQALEYCDKQIYRALFLPSLLGGGEKGGSYSLGQVHLELFNTTVAALAADYIDAELEQLWRPLIEWNFGPQENYGDFPVQGTMSIEEKKTWTDIFCALSDYGAVGGDSDMDFIREMLGFPKAKEDEVRPQWKLEKTQEELEQQELERLELEKQTRKQEQEPLEKPGQDEN